MFCHYGDTYNDVRKAHKYDALPWADTQNLAPRYIENEQLLDKFLSTKKPAIRVDSAAIEVSREYSENIKSPAREEPSRREMTPSESEGHQSHQSGQPGEEEDNDKIHRAMRIAQDAMKEIEELKNVIRNMENGQTSKKPRLDLPTLAEDDIAPADDGIYGGAGMLPSRQQQQQQVRHHTSSPVARCAPAHAHGSPLQPCAVVGPVLACATARAPHCVPLVR